MFPFSLPAPTAFYLVVLLVTLALHVVFMNYVLGGAIYLFWAQLSGSRARSVDQAGTLPNDAQCPVDPVAQKLGEWMPFAISAAITAGVAPLLFIQILYQREFYTANLLLFHRWMAMVPVLIVGFYLAYMMRSARFASRSPATRIAVGAAAVACFLFAAWSWAENHLLSIAQDAWPGHYEAGRMFYAAKGLAARVGVWVFSAMPTTALLVAWQMRASRANSIRSAERRLARFALTGIAFSVVCAGIYTASLAPAARASLAAWPNVIYPVLMFASLGVLAAFWAGILRSRAHGNGTIALLSAGQAIYVLAACATRELARVSQIDMSTLLARHANAASVGGFTVFVAFALINAVVVAACIRTVARSRSAASPSPV